MGFLRLNKNQIGLGAVGNSHIDSSDKILESNLVLDFSTSSLNTAIGSINSDLSTLTNKKVAVFGQIVNVAVSIDTNASAAIDASLAGIFPSALVAGGDAANSGLITVEPFNKVPLKIANSNLPLEMTEGGPDIFGRLVYDGGAAEGSRYTVEFFYMDGAVETAAILPANANVDMLVPMSLDLAEIPFQSLTHGVAFVDGLPAEHFHPISSVTGLQDELTSINDDLTAVETRFGVIEGEIDTIQSDAVTLAGRVTTAEGEIDTIQSDAVTLAGRVTTAEGEIDTLQTNVDALQESSVSIGDVALISSIKEGVDLSAQADGVLDTFVVGENFVASTLRVFVNGSRQTRGVQYNENGASGEFTFVSGAIPESTDSVTVDYVKLV